MKEVLQILDRAQDLSKNQMVGNEQNLILGIQAASHSEMAKSLGFVVSSKLSITCKEPSLKQESKESEQGNVWPWSSRGGRRAPRCHKVSNGEVKVLKHSDQPYSFLPSHH